MQVIGLMAQVAMIVVLGVIALALGYATGHKDGTKEGFDRGKAIGRHAAGREVSK